MWEQIAKLKHSYLHQEFCNVNPCIIDRTVNKIRDTEPTNPQEYKHPFNQPAYMQPCLFGVSVEKSKVPEAFGLWCIPQLIKQLCDCDPLIHFRAVNRLTDVLKDSEKCYEAIQKNIVYYLCRLLHKYHELETTSSFVENLCICLELIASHQDGAMTILINPHVFNCLYYIIKNYYGTIDIFAAFVLIALANHQKIADDLIQQCHLEKIMETIDDVECVCFEFYEYLSLLIARNPQKAFKLGYFPFLLPKIAKENDCQTNIMKSFAHLVNCDDGQKCSDKNGVIRVLHGILQNKQIKPCLLRHTILALQNITLSTTAKWRCNELFDLPYILLEHIHTRTDSNLQLFALQCMINICEMPSIREVVRKLMKARIKKVHCLDEINKKFKKTLMNLLRHKNYKMPKEKKPSKAADEYRLACETGTEGEDSEDD